MPPARDRTAVASLATTILAAAMLAATLVAAPAPAHAYEFRLESQTVGQGYQLRWLRFSERDRLVNRRRFTQTLRLEVWDILRPGPDLFRPERPRPRPAFELSFTSSLRIDHDFGDYLGGELVYFEDGSAEVGEAVDLVPELGDERIALDVPWAYLEGRSRGGAVAVRLGRQIEIEPLDWYAFDGLSVAVRTPLYLGFSAHGGLIVRSASLWGSPTLEPDGTQGADCRRVEAAMGLWLPADECEQRQALMPGFGFALYSEGLSRLQLRASYRRVQSPTAGAFGPDAPGWGVNEEKAVLSVRGVLAGGGLVPEAAVRWNGVLGEIDEARAGLRLGWAEHALTGDALYSLPSFDADSIFNVFAVEPYTDFRLTYDAWPGRGRLRGYLRGTWRDFDGDARALGVAGGARWFDSRTRFRLDLSHEDGHGGLRSGGDASARVRVGQDWLVDGRVTVIHIDEDLAADRDFTTFGLQAGATVALGPGIGLYFLVEENINRFESQFRVLTILDLAFVPEI